MKCISKSDKNCLMVLRNLKPPQLFITDFSKAVVLLLFYVAYFSLRVSLTFHLLFVHVTLVRFRLLSGLSFGKGLITRLTICSLCVLNIFYFSCFPFWLRGQNLGSDCSSSWSLHTYLLLSFYLLGGNTVNHVNFMQHMLFHVYSIFCCLEVNIRHISKVLTG